jgi:two-component system, LytTR family, response regulator
MLRGVIIEDELSARESLRELLGQCCPDLEVVGEAGDVEAGKALIRAVKPDLLFLDIELPDGDGFDILRDFDRFSFNIIFTTAYSDYAIKAFKYSATQYLLKPIDPHDLKDAVQQAEIDLKTKNLQERFEMLLSKVIGKDQKKIVLVTTQQIYVVNLTEIVMCESEKNYTHFSLEDGSKITVAKTLKDFEDVLLSNTFIKCHRQYIVNLDHIRSIEKEPVSFIRLTQGFIAPVSNRRKDEVIRIIKELFN